ncbi:ephrin type-B receptor 1-like [Periophthalmus magnuspinnatus]|uniref:ephrin type-B receptor 1-like n=1 Tax=Periophthalmus magnuspinnatus TaxID=409849 RepID=UPI0024363BF0|nr:ephrin type-B receptor 1-like [Periophthalmus magnuspinnatus]
MGVCRRGATVATRATRAALVLLWVTTTARAVEETVMDTRTATAELGWISFPANGWEEVSGYDENLNTIRTYQVCNVFEPSQNNWLLTTYIDRRAAQRIYVEIRFTVRDCASIPSVLGSCKETFNLYYLETDRTVTEGVKGMEYWANAPFLKVDTIAADESFSQVDFGGRLMKVNTEVRSFGPLSKGKGFHLAFQDLGACMSLLAVRVFYKKCPSVVQNFAYFPETLTGAESTSLVIARGSCIPNAEEVDVPIKLYCNGDGEWMVPIGSCSCKAGYEPDNGNLCRACPQGTFKSIQGAGLCQQCPLYSRSTIEAATLCGCRNGYYRGDMDQPEDSCTSVPSAPRNLVSIVNQTSVVLDWHPPRDTGHREDLSYNVICRRCHSPERRACQPCDDSVGFVPGKRSLKDTRVEISKLRAHTSYTFDVQAVNGVSNKSPYPAQQLSINITTNQAAPSVVPIMHQVSSTSRSFSLSWPPPEQPNGIILDYEIRYYDKVQSSVLNSSVMQSETTSVVLEGLRPGTGYVVQVRARTVAGYGAYSKEMLFQTLTDDEYKSELGQQLSLIAGSLVGGVCIVSLVAIAIICSRRRQKESVYGDKLQQYNTGEVTLRPDMFNGPTPTVTFPTLSEGHSSPGVKIYIDPFTYEDPNEAVREFAKEIDPSCVKIEEVIGSGEFGEVYKGRLKPVGKKELPVAIKTLKVGYSERQRRDFLSEASIMGQFDQPNIIRLEGVVTKSRPTMIITEFMENGALDSFLRQNDGQFPVIQLVGMLRGIASGMRYLAEMSYVHRDLAARNILVNSNLVCKVSDFGLSRYLEEDTSDPTYTSSLGGKIPVRWTAPEAIAYRKFTSASDVWSYGIVTWEVMSYGERPYWDMSNQDVINAIEQDFRLPAPMDCPVVLHQLMLDCWQKDRNARPKFPDIVSVLDKMIRNPASLKTGINNIPPGPCIHPLLDRGGPDLSRVSSVEDWLAALKMTQYRDSFLGSGFTSLPLVTQITAEDLQRIGVQLAGHQKKILTSVQSMRPHQDDHSPTESV